MNDGPAATIAYLAVDFDKTLICEDFLVQWVFHTLLKPDTSFRNRLCFFLKSAWRGPASILLARRSNRSELAVRIAHGTFRNVPVTDVAHLMNRRPKWKKGYLINLNPALLETLRDIMTEINLQSSSPPTLFITSQGAPSLAIRTFLERPDVAERMAWAGVSIDPLDEDSIMANRLEVSNERFTGKLTPPVITKHNRLQFFPERTLFVGDGKDEAAFKTSAKTGVRFLNYRKISSEVR